jgi:predicted nucleic acid-binding protein
LLVAQERLREAERELAKLGTVIFDDVAAANFDRLRGDKKLRKIGRNDILIACIALANQATLVTRNVKDFQALPGLKVENWAD